MTRTAIILLNYNGLSIFGAKIFKMFLGSLLKSITSDDVVLFVDNGSTDESTEFVESVFNGYLAKGLLDVIRLRRNYGWSGGNNRGAVYALRKYNPAFLVFVNNDVIFTRDWIDNLLKYMSLGNLAIASPLVYEVGLKAFHLGDLVLSDGGVKPIILEPKQLGFLKHKHRLGYVRIPSANGSALAVHSKVFRILRGFDEGFKAYYDEVDFCYRALKLGVRIGVVLESIVYHFGSLTIKSISGLVNKKISLTTESSLYFMAKHFKLKGLSRTLLSNTKWAIKLTLYRDLRGLMGVLRGLVYGIPKALKTIL